MSDRTSGEVDPVSDEPSAAVKPAAAKTAAPTTRPSGAKKVSAKKAPAKKAPAKKTPAKKSSTAKATKKKATKTKSSPVKPGPEEPMPITDSPAGEGDAVSGAQRHADRPPVDVAFSETETDDHDLWGDDWSDLGSSWDDPDPGARSEGPPKTGGGDGTELFQNAMLELISAARTALDTAEELVSDPHAIGTAIESIRGIAGEVFRAGVHNARSGISSDDPGDDADDDDDFQSIRVDDA